MKSTNASRIALALGLSVFAAPPAWALHKCTTKEGKVIYTEFECEKDAKASGVPIYDSAGVDTKTKGQSGSSVSTRGPRSTAFDTDKTKTTTLPPMPAMGKPVQMSPLINSPNPGVRQNARYQYEQESKAQREKHNQDMKEWRDKAATSK